jgi:hypothetical protein
MRSYITHNSLLCAVCARHRVDVFYIFHGHNHYDLASLLSASARVWDMKRNTRKRAAGKYTWRWREESKAKEQNPSSISAVRGARSPYFLYILTCVCNVVFVRCLGISSLLIPHDRSRMCAFCDRTFSRLGSRSFFTLSSRSLKITHQFNIWGVCCAIWELALLFHSQ